MAQVLYSSSVVRDKIIDILKDNSCKRTIVVAFVGDGAEEYLSKPKGINLICWPQPGSTNPKTLQHLMSKGVKVSFCDKLHMKIYCSEKHGTVIASSNLTNNGLGIGKLREAGVYLKANEFKIENILGRLTTRKPNEEDFEKLFAGYHENIKKFKQRKDSQADNFLTWLINPFREKFKIAVYNSTNEKYTVEEIEAANEIGKTEPSDSFHINKNDYKAGDWLLTIEVRNDKLIRNMQWMYIEAVVVVKGKSEYKYRALQLRNIKAHQPPFLLTPKFKNALFIVSHKVDVHKLSEQSRKPVSPNVIRKIEQVYKRN